MNNNSLSNIAEGLQKPILKDEKWQIINILEKLPSRPKTLDEAEGMIVSAYQNYLEKSWISKLKSDNKTAVHYKVLYSIKEKP
jgi:peptidyl-prolyl cis-trans isomerase SurA